MERYICIHGHFYQPPRENAWLESVELQDSAYPYHDWNERVTAECYSPNAKSRILDGRNCITEIVNNYSSISFNFGPTLLAWMKSNSPETYRGIMAADRLSHDRFGGHGSAIAQPYNHMIMPLANLRDKRTQTLWGIRDFEHRFGRQPEGMWLPETAVDIETLEILAEFGIKFTVLAQHQAGQTRKIGTHAWQDVSGGRVDPSRAYQVNLPSGKTISVFFYDGPISRAVAFEGLLENGDAFSHRLLDGFDNRRTWDQLVNIATDGESYGHHHQFGDMALAYVIHRFQNDKQVKLTNYGEFLEKCPPTYEVSIAENTSWSCVHGIERWRSDCGCSTGGAPGWNQAWRAPLREGMDFLRDSLSPKYEQVAAALFEDPWKARDDYVQVVLDRSPANTARFLRSHVSRRLDASDRVKALKLLELQRNAMLMYTSCGWFFTEVSGIESLQVLQYAGRVVQLANEVFGDSTESGFLRYLEAASSNIAENGDARQLYEQIIKPTMVDLSKVAAHFAMSSLFEEYEGSARIYCYNVESEHYHREDCGKARLAVGRVKVTSEITTESEDFSFGVVHLGDHNLNAGVRTARPRAESYNELLHEMVRSCLEADFPSAIRLLDSHFPDSMYSLKTLFRDEQRKIIDAILSSTMDEVESAYRQVYNSHFPLMRFLASLGNPLPKVLESTAEFIVNNDLRRMLEGESPDIEGIKRLLADAASWNIKIDQAVLKHTYEQSIARMASELTITPDDIGLVNDLARMVDLGKLLPCKVDWGIPQNLYYSVLKKDFPRYQSMAAEADESAKTWIGSFASLGEKLSVCVL